MPTALLFVRKIHEKLFLQAGNGGVMQQNKVKIKTSHAQKKENRAGYFFIAPYLTFFTVFTGIPFLMAIGILQKYFQTEKSWILFGEPLAMRLCMCR